MDSSLIIIIIIIKKKKKQIIDICTYYEQRIEWRM